MKRVSRTMARVVLAVSAAVPLLVACMAPKVPLPPPDNVLAQPAPDSVRQRATRRLQLATAYYEQEQDDVALQETRAALQIDPRFGEAYSLLGLIHQRQKASALAERSFEQALQLAIGPDGSPAELGAVQHNYGWFLCQQGRLAEGQTQLARALSQPGYTAVVKSWSVLGDCQRRGGQILQARNSWLNALRHDPNNAWVRAQLAELDGGARPPVPADAAPASKSDTR